MKKKLGVLGYWAGYNYGSECTNYATYRYLEDNGYDVAMYDIALSPSKTIYKRPPYFALNPYKENCLHGRYKDKAELKQINNDCNTFISTSDQQLAAIVYHMTGETATLDFIHDDKKKIFYAASFGFDKFFGSQVDISTISYFLRKADFFSVREDSGVQLAKNTFGIDSTLVLDPVFLLNADVWKSLASSGRYNNNNTLFGYILDFNEEKNKFINEYTKNTLVKPLLITDAHKDFFNIESETHFKIEKRAMVEDWLSAIKDCDFYITDSFHGTCLGIIFQKQFLVFTNNRGKTRLESLLRIFGLEDRLVSSCKEAQAIINNKILINYEELNSVLEFQKNKSKNWLINAIETDLGNKCYSAYDILDNRIDRVKNLYMNANGQTDKYTDIFKLFLNKHKIFKRYYRYKILSKLLFGEKRKHYKEKAQIWHEKIRQIRRFEKEINDV